MTWPRRADRGAPVTTSLLVVTIVVMALPLYARPAPAASVAPGAPGAAGYWATGRKMGVGAAAGRASRVWFTIAEGILSEAYYPTVDTPDVGSLQYVVTDGHSFTQRESVDTLHVIRALDAPSLAFEVANTARDGSYRIVTDYACDPLRSVLLLHSRFEALRPGARSDRVYVLFRPNVNGTSLANAAEVRQEGGHTVVTAANPNGSYGPVTVALDARPGLGAASVGYHLTSSDGWRELSRVYRLVYRYDSAPNGTVVATAATDLRSGHDITLALAFGSGPAAAIAAARAALDTPFAAQLAAYVSGWHAYATVLRPPAGLPPEDLAQFYLGALTLKASEDKTYEGAIVASPTIPWGNVRVAGADRVGGYHLVWARDLYEIVSALLAAGDVATAREALRYLFDVQQGTDGGMPQNTWLNGDINQSAVQLDQAAYPLILAWQLGQTDAATYRRHIAPGANYLVHYGPATQQERWEESAGYSPSTIAAEIAGLVCAAAAARRNGDVAGAALFGAVADDWARHVAGWTATRSGHLSPRPYYIRIDDNTDPNDGDLLGIANGGGAYDERDVVDAGFLELVRLGIVPARDPLIVDSLAVVDARLRVLTRNGPGWYRYNHDGYGENADASPFNGGGIGRLWPVLTGERGEYDLAAGRRTDAAAMLATMRRFAYGAGMIPEQVWDRADVPAAAGSPADDESADLNAGSIGLSNGRATGSAGPLNWSMAQYVRLAADLGAGRLLEQPSVVADRYRGGLPPGGPPLDVTVPAANCHHFTSPLLVRGRATPGAGVLIAVYSFNKQQDLIARVRGDGSFSAMVTLDIGENDLVVVATDTHGRGTVVGRRVIRQLV